MTMKQRLLIATGAAVLALVGITGALASGRAKCDGAACPKVDCAADCPDKGPCPPCPACPGC